jgi:hypothetical protein
MKDNFDDLLKRKWEEQHFPVDEQHRADMIALLDGQKRRKVFPFWWISGLGLAALVAGYFLVARHDAPSAAMHQSNDGINVDANQNTQLQPGSKGTSEAISNAAGSALNTASNTKAEAVPVTTTTGSADKNNPSGNLNETAPGQKNNTNNKPSSSSKKSTDKQSQQQTKSEVKPVIPITLSDKPASGEIIEKGVSPDGTFRVDEQAARSYQIISNAVAVTIEDPEADITPYIPPKPGSRIRVNVDEIDLLELSGIHYTSDQAPGRITPKTSFNHTVYVFGEAGAGMILASKPDYNTGWKLRAGKFKSPGRQDTCSRQVVLIFSVHQLSVRPALGHGVVSTVLHLTNSISYIPGWGPNTACTGMSLRHMEGFSTCMVHKAIL